MSTGGQLPRTPVAAQTRRGSRFEVHRWGARFGSRWFVWWDLWAHAFCWETSVQAAAPEPEQFCGPCADGECTAHVRPE